jgi:hypothetical protein
MSVSIYGLRALKQVVKGAIFFIAAVSLISCGDSDDDGNETKSLKQTTKEAYIYALPAVEHNRLLTRTFNKGNINHINGTGELASAENQTGVGPNIDTLYSTGILDIRYEPVVVTVPPIDKERYFSIQLLDIFTNSEYLGSISNRTEGDYLIARKDWNGTVPEGIKGVVKLSTSLVLALGRIQVFDSKDDEEAKSLVDGSAFKVQKLSTFAATQLPAYEPLSWSAIIYDAKNENADTEEFFQTFNLLVQYQLLSDEDKKVLKGFEALHLGANEAFSKDNFTDAEWDEIEEGVAEAKAEISSVEQYLSNAINGWVSSPENAARWGSDYLTRAIAAWFAPHINTKEEATYFVSLADTQGVYYNGSNNYTITFKQEDIPNVKYFYSLTLYRPNGLFFSNSLNRYGIRSIDNITKETDGSFTLYIQNENPAGVKEKNWIPAPKGIFTLSFRLYGEIGNTTLPPVVRE